MLYMVRGMLWGDVEHLTLVAATPALKSGAAAVQTTRTRVQRSERIVL